jgi:hypothetical protein
VNLPLVQTFLGLPLYYPYITPTSSPWESIVKNKLPSPLGDCVVIASKGGETVRFQSFRMRVFYIMASRRLYKIECFHTLGAPESERLKVTALNLWEASPSSFDRPLPGEPPTRPPLPFFEKSVFSYYDTPSWGERVGVRGEKGMGRNIHLAHTRLCRL